MRRILLGMEIYNYAMSHDGIIGKMFLISTVQPGILIHCLIRYCNNCKVKVATIKFYFHLQNLTSFLIAGHVKYMFTSPRP